jgi:hypothetical protein
MMLHAALYLATILATASERPDGRPPKAPAGPPPALVFAKLDRDGTLVVHESVSVPVVVPTERQVQVKRGDQVVTEKVTVYVQVFRTEQRSSTWKRFQAFGADGKEVGAKALAQHFKEWAPALLSRDGKPVDRYYRQFFKDDIPVIVTPQVSSSPRRHPEGKPERDGALPDKARPPADGAPNRDRPVKDR